MTVYTAAPTRKQGKMIDAADVMTAACANGHEKYREKAGIAD